MFKVPILYFSSTQYNTAHSLLKIPNTAWVNNNDIMITLVILFDIVTGMTWGYDDDSFLCLLFMTQKFGESKPGKTSLHSMFPVLPPGLILWKIPELLK